MTSWTLKSIPPHDWYICLDIGPYFDHEHDPEMIFENGFTRPIPLENRDIIATLYFNGETENPEFTIQTEELLTGEEIDQANKVYSRILGTELDLRPFYDRMTNDQVLEPKMNEFYGLKRMSRASLFEDIVNRIIQMRLSHKPTAKKMAYKVRERYGAHLVYDGNTLPAWPRPFQLAGADPVQIHKLGPTRRKGEYITGLAHDIIAGNIDLDWLDTEADPLTFYDSISNVRGIGPTSAQDLMLFRPDTEAVFPSNKTKNKEKGLRRWIILSYGADPDKTTDTEFNKMIKHWQGFEAAAIEFLFANWMINKKYK